MTRDVYRENLEHLYHGQEEFCFISETFGKITFLKGDHDEKKI
jgi:hypothetical protein